MSGLLSFLDGLQRECGVVIPVDRYVQEALYHPEFGYYTRNIRGVGRRGDFATSASLGEALGAAIARWAWANRIAENAEEGGKRGRREGCFPPFSLFPRSKNPLFPSWHVIEAGAGTGELARTILRRLGMWRRRGLTYHIVETSPVLREEQRKTLPQFRVLWHETMREALAASSGEAVIFSNELIDAFPCRVHEFDGGAWCEIGVRIDGRHIREAAVDRAILASAAFEMAAPQAGQRVETQPAAAEWFASWSGSVTRAHLLTIDYGGTMPGLYHRRPLGTLRAYFHHQRMEGQEVFHRFGKQDITCDVNFSDVRSWTERCGWRTLALTTQAEFLKVYGAMRVTGLHDAQFADHSGAGGAFKVLIQSIGETSLDRRPRLLKLPEELPRR